MKSKTKKSSNHKALIIILSVIVFIVGISLGSYFVVKNYMTNRALNYLTEKYNVEVEDFKPLDYGFAYHHIYLNNDAIPELTNDYIDYRWEFEYNGRKFFVNREDGVLYDDYQLEDIEDWAVEWLQNNVDKRIIAIDITHTTIITYLLKEQSNDYIFTKCNIKDFLDSSHLDSCSLDVYLYDENINYNDINIVKQNTEISHELTTLLLEKTPNSRIRLYNYVDTNKYKIVLNKEKYYSWDKEMLLL